VLTRIPRGAFSLSTCSKEQGSQQREARPEGAAATSVRFYAQHVLLRYHITLATHRQKRHAAAPLIQPGRGVTADSRR